MGFNVKSTTLGGLGDWFCPHYCLLCGRVGAILCAECKSYNMSGWANRCLKCGVIVRDVCVRCALPYDAAWVVGRRDNKLGALVDKFKYQSVRAVGRPMAEMMSEVIPGLAAEVTVVPVPTIRKHVRERGLDHTALLAQRIAKLRGWRFERTVARMANTVQVGADARMRKSQAKSAYALKKKIDFGRAYLVVDDVCTTGASLEAVCRLLKENGAQKAMVAVFVKSGEN